MKKTAFLAILSMLLVLGSCDRKNGTNGGGGSVVDIVDPAIVATWEIKKFEALDKYGKKIKETEDSLTITATYHKFQFSQDKVMKMWFGKEQQTIDVDFHYDSIYGILLFADYGYATTVVLNDTSYVFTCDSFYPVDWYEDSSVASANVYCKKVK